MKMLVSTIGDFMLRSSHTGDELNWQGISLVRDCPFVQSKIALNVVKCHATNLKDSATTEDWQNWLKESEGNEELAVESFVSAYTIEEVQ